MKFKGIKALEVFLRETLRHSKINIISNRFRQTLKVLIEAVHFFNRTALLNVQASNSTCLLGEELFKFLSIMRLLVAFPRFFMIDCFNLLFKTIFKL